MSLSQQVLAPERPNAFSYLSSLHSFVNLGAGKRRLLPPGQPDWWNNWSIQGGTRRWAVRTPQRAHENRPSAVRALILYPLNALVEDQLARLRDGLDGP